MKVKVKGDLDGYKKKKKGKGKRITTRCWSKTREIPSPEFFSKEWLAKQSSGMAQVHKTLLRITPLVGLQIKPIQLTQVLHRKKVTRQDRRNYRTDLRYCWTLHITVREAD